MSKKTKKSGFAQNVEAQLAVSNPITQHKILMENIDSLKTYKQIDETFNPLKESNRYKEWKGAVEKVLT